MWALAGFGVLVVAYVAAPTYGEAWQGGRMVGHVRLAGSAGAVLRIDVCHAWEAMRLAALRDGVTLICRSGYRTYEKQAELRAAYEASLATNRPLPVAAQPGHSNHQLGIVGDFGDINDPKVRSWLERNAARFGFHATVPGEPWHYEYRP
jgi:D-alanyl-D-alanine carboxypeptidase